MGISLGFIIDVAAVWALVTIHAGTPVLRAQAAAASVWWNEVSNTSACLG